MHISSYQKIDTPDPFGILTFPELGVLLHVLHSKLYKKYGDILRAWMDGDFLITQSIYGFIFVQSENVKEICKEVEFTCNRNLCLESNTFIHVWKQKP